MNYNVEPIYWDYTRTRMGIVVTSGDLKLEAKDGIGHIIVNILRRNVPANSREYWDECAIFWQQHSDLLPLFENRVPSGALAFCVNNSTEYPFPDWLHNQLIKRWGWDRIGELAESEKVFCIAGYGVDGVYPIGAVSAVLTWEQWEQLLAYAKVKPRD